MCGTVRIVNAIEINHLTKIYYSRAHETTVVDGLSFSVEKGSVFGFLGPNGAGKTTTIKMLVGLAKPSRGTVAILGESPESLSVRSKIGFMPENASFYLYLTGYEFLAFMADIFRIPRSEKTARIEKLLHEVNLYDARNLQIRKYSKGMGQRLGLAQALINNPEVVLLDEPLDGLDPLGRAEAKEMMLKLKKAGTTIFFNSHILSDVEDICDQVGIIDRGKLVAFGTVADVKSGFGTLEEAFVDIIRKKREKPIEISRN